MIIIFWFRSDNLTEYHFKSGELLAQETCKVALIKVLTVAAVRLLCVQRTAESLKKENKP